MGNIASAVLSAWALPFNIVAMFTNFIATITIKCTGIVVGVPSTIPLLTEDFVKHFSVLVDTCLIPSGNTPQSLTHTVDNQKILIGFSCRSLFETSLNVLKESSYLSNNKNKALRILATPIHHKSYVEIMERIGTSIEVMPFQDSMRGILVNKETEKMVKNCDIIVVTHLFGRSFDLSELIELKNRHNKILIVDGVMGGCRSDTHNTIGIDLDLYSTGQDKRPVAVGGGYCIARHEAFSGMEERTLSYRVVGRIERLKKILNTWMLRVLYQHRPLYIVALFAMKLLNVQLSSVTGSIRKGNPGFDSDNYLLCPSEAMVQSVKLELPNILCMEDRYKACWKKYLTLLPPDVRHTFYPFYEDGEDVILPYNQILLPPGHEDKFLKFCDRYMIGCLGNQNYKALKCASVKYHEFNSRIMNFVTVIRPLDEMALLTNKVVEYYAQECK
mmetsp:Transcript_8326/g.14109  ORF Transcript_8326/g.14109 Transcript_8326/m.14109 type:complete len:444 (+) Transcript_8326:128-1459(+)|eukprot:CAMPEP_0114430638 /NCGR_PEP_ID=MMETSP0103-20121206/10150_1 /TAXON_ID=37642 ORGANISM="Paraphysomonas imperforata, Strain PA2" /NCGR_SAMPLE_ID=MMETSP0103 /ASSEMBLY_ACC=CAM_ASM_000201 /LENGTH=443 /DNA_ID=CAMNT_0001600103 /DNA_START=112 /DNA_END=1443 /DNA_ORIENTATION=-